jgi:hypothetical protein|uniref:Uncharacterized protein n=1 Tax=Siphoviridae sp. ctNYt19 TaxID=2825472 RepID=A0A8S5QIS5_9CAUD|nr:MAG TPA: hypothetical protein [Siphoviridae sp. ctNYt19]
MKIRKNVINALEKIVLIGMYGFIFARVFLFMVGIDL